MTNKDALYSNLSRLLNNISAESTVIESYSLENQTEDKVEQLLLLAGRIETEISNRIADAITADEAIVFEQSNFELIDDYKDIFPDFPNARFGEIILLLNLINIATRNLQEDFEYDGVIDTTIYNLVPLSDQFGTEVFQHSDSTQINNSFVLFNFDKLEEVISYFNSPTLIINNDLLIQLISKIGIEEEIILNSFYLLIYSGISNQISKCKAYISLHMVLKGKVVHVPYEYSNVLSTSSSRPLLVTNSYQQFKDALTIFSEYNSQEDILDKFIRLYHIIENFMFKSPIVELERKQNGTPFSFRDFQKIQSRINKSEFESLKRFIKKVFEKEYHNADDFKSYTFTLLQSKITNTPQLIIEDNFNKLLTYLNIEANNGDNLIYTNITLNKIDKNYSEILYGIRNSLVHNKESEFHLTHETMLNHFEIGDTVKVLLEEFLLPTMEEIIIFLLTESNNEIVWFSNSNLMLWEEN